MNKSVLSLVEVKERRRQIRNLAKSIDIQLQGIVELVERNETSASFMALEAVLTDAREISKLIIVDEEAA